MGLRGRHTERRPAAPGGGAGCAGTLEVNEYLLNLDHGLSEIYADSLTWSECSRQHLLARQAAARIRY